MGEIHAGRVVAFGELLLRLDAPDHERIVQAGQFRTSYTGGEANVAVSLAQLGVEAFVVSKVPANELGQAAVNHLRRYGVRTDFIARGGPRLGLLLVETGASQRPGKVVYDRLHTSFREIVPGEFDWPTILSGADWLHVTGTAPAGGESVRQVLDEALTAARRLDVRVSLDCSFRSSLWTQAEAATVLREMLDRVDLLFGSEDDARQLFGVDAVGDDSLVQLARQFDLRYVAYTEREVHSASENTIGAKFFDGSAVASSRKYTLQVVDRIGAGDAFAAGVLFGLLSGWEGRQTVEFAAAASCLKHSIPGDFNLVTRDEIDRLVRDGTSGRLVR